MPKLLTSCWTHGPGLTCSHHAAGARALTSPPCGCCCKRLSRHVALPAVGTVCLLREKHQLSSGLRTSVQADSGLSR